MLNCHMSHIVYGFVSTWGMGPKRPWLLNGHWWHQAWDLGVIAFNCQFYSERHTHIWIWTMGTSVRISNWGVGSVDHVAPRSKHHPTLWRGHTLSRSHFSHASKNGGPSTLHDDMMVQTPRSFNVLVYGKISSKAWFDSSTQGVSCRRIFSHILG